MIVVPAGSFCMGSPVGETGRASDEGPVHKVTIRRPFAVGIYEVTFNEWRACVSQKGCTADAGGGRRPVLVNFNDAKEYVAWLSKKTGEEYRLLTEAEWEYAARARTTTAYSFGNTISASQANYAEGRLARTVSVGSYPANAFGLHDVHGNAWEWVEDCYHNNYNGAPADGSAWVDAESCSRVFRGGSWLNFPSHLRSAKRCGSIQNFFCDSIGFRVARTL